MLNYYQDYLEAAYPEIEFSLSTEWIRNIESTNWDEPQSSLELNNVAVMALIEAEVAGDQQTRITYLEMAFNLLNRQVEEIHPLQIAHLALLYFLIDERTTAVNLSFPQFISLLQPVDQNSAIMPPGLIYLPSPKKFNNGEIIKKILETDNGNQQALLMSLEVVLRSPLTFYNGQSQRALQLALSLNLTSLENNFKLGLAYLLNQQIEGLYYLQYANSLKPGVSEIIQALYLAYKDLPELPIAQYWHQMGQNLAETSKEWDWTKLPLESKFSYVVFQEYLMTVEASLKSIVTSVMLAEGDWFESEMELWRNILSQGMTVIDVGANVGVYTLSAASRVGQTGKVIAIEPFSFCVRCLEETCRLNNLSWVKIYGSAASKEAGIGFLSLQSSSELNEIIKGETEESQGLEKVTFITLDSLIEKEELQQVDWLKIDAEGHEIEVLLGSQTLIERFSPKILYENISGDKGSNQEVSEFLQGKGYQLFRYRSYLEELVPIESLENLQACLNIIAIKDGKQLS